MKHILKGILLFLIIGMASCEENEIPQIDDENGVTLAQFGKSSLVLPTPEEGAMGTVTVIVTTVSTQDRTIEVMVDPASTASSSMYEVSDLFIPAGSYTGTIKISSNYESLPESGSSELILNLSDIEGSDARIEKGTLTVEMFRTCPIVVEDLVGTWSGTTSWGYDTEVVTFLNDDGELMINGLTFGWFQDWWGEVIVTNDPVKMEIDVETGEITIPEQFYITSTWNGAPQPAYNLTGSGMVVNACQKKLEISPILIQGGGAIDGSAYGPAFKEVITLVEE